MNYKATKIPSRFWGLSLADYKTPPGEEQARTVVKEYIANLDDHLARGTGLTLAGHPGIGKTMLMSIIGMAAADEGHSVLYMPMAKYVRNLLNLMAWQGVGDMEDEFVAVTRLMLKARNRVQFLLLDDVGKEHQTHTRFTEDEFDFLVRLRYDKGLPTIITSNVRPEEWNHRYSGAMEDFSYEAFPPYLIGESASSFRKRSR